MKLIAFLIVALCAAKAVAAQTSPNSPYLPDAAVADALKTFKDLSVDPASLKLFGFSSPAEVAGCDVTATLPQYFVGLGDVAAFQKGRDPRPLMKFDTEALLVECGGQARAVVMLRYFNPPPGSATAVAPGWRMASIEGPVVAQAIERIIAPWKGFADKGDYLLYIPALGQATFVVSHAARQVSAGQAYTLFDNGDLNMKAGQSKSVQDVFEGLQPKAQAEMNAPHNGPGA